MIHHEFRFDPPLAIPGRMEAKITACGEIVQDEQPSHVQILVADDKGKVIAHGLFKHVTDKPGLYRLIAGDACTSEDGGGIRIQKASDA